jgi:dihydroorotase
MIARDLALASQTGAHVHIAHVSTAGGVELIRRAMADGARVTTEVTPHHIVLTHEAVMRPSTLRPGSGQAGSGRADQFTLAYDTNAKMYPPLRRTEDVEACIEGLRDGTIDAIATDHAPHAVQEKLCEFDDAAFGIVGLETAIGLAMRATGSGLTLERVIEALTIGPVRALGLNRKIQGLGTLSVGAPADVVLLNPTREWTVEPSQFASKGKNTPLGGWTLRGEVVATIYAGHVVYARDEVKA